ncbi:ABC transporter, putative [Bodo saltans]|uniref:ABC transporter, putative n=1 Tax=Bodo saltans TaxID=75058 RepID=A0A0S4IQ43_BODSA|nr:ABC transporter, putative [Bodo saltans]|eukprot:CUE70979.1 ABC transporter, putative [Bodo saltans]
MVYYYEFNGVPTTPVCNCTKRRGQVTWRPRWLQARAEADRLGGRVRRQAQARRQGHAARQRGGARQWWLRHGHGFFGSTYCSDPSTREPVTCVCGDNADLNVTDSIVTANGTILECNGGTLYCPAGATDVQLCPRGFYCTAPNVSVACIPTQFCDYGTFAPKLCAAGFYCPTPNASYVCPEGNYCPEGTVLPLSCNFLTVCPAGLASESRSLLTVFVLIVVSAVFGRYEMRRRQQAGEMSLLSKEARDFIAQGGLDEEDFLAEVVVGFSTSNRTGGASAREAGGAIHDNRQISDAHDETAPTVPQKEQQAEAVDPLYETSKSNTSKHSNGSKEWKKRGISGGQRKRVNIGMEMVALPAILFLDEPTSGLDSSSSMSVCGSLRDTASVGVTVIAVIHQPRNEIFNMFHKVLLLAKDGSLR